VWFTGKIDGEIFHFFNNHWPSRWGGQQASEPRRVVAATILRHIVDSLKNVEPDSRIVIMGDFNDDPNNRSIEQVLRAKGTIANLQEGDLFNPFHAMHRAGYGTLAWQDGWNIFDMIMVSQNMINGSSDRFQLQPNTTARTRRNREPFFGFIFNESFLQRQDGRFKGYPWRTYIGDTYQGGYSDHFPVYILISK
jgi:endonuclease/exonuclease/phosphatase family metal-dependent hydrolase